MSQVTKAVRVAFQGEVGAYSERAIKALFPNPAGVPMHSFHKVFEAVEIGAVDFGVVPLENSHAGSINESYDLLVRHGVQIVAECVVRISHCLLACEGTSMDQVSVVYSHPQALKAADTALRALGHLVAWRRVRLNKICLLIIGGPSGHTGSTEPQHLRRLARELGVASSVRFIPAQPHGRLPPFYQAADVCLVPSHTESFGLVALEAQASGLPVVASAVGGLRSIVRHGQTGFLVEPGAAAAFAERTWRILSDPPLAASMSSLAVCSSSELSWRRSADELLAIYTASANNFTEKAAAPGI